MSQEYPCTMAAAGRFVSRFILIDWPDSIFLRWKSSAPSRGRTARSVLAVSFLATGKRMWSASLFCFPPKTRPRWWWVFLTGVPSIYAMWRTSSTDPRNRYPIRGSDFPIYISLKSITIRTSLHAQPSHWRWRKSPASMPWMWPTMSPNEWKNCNGKCSLTTSPSP